MGFKLPPRYLRNEIESVLIAPEQIQKRVRQLGRQLEADYNGKDLVVVALLNGAVLFLADLLRQLKLPLKLDFIGVSSYRFGVVSQKLYVTKELGLDIRGRDVLLVDDILDTGKTIARALRKLRALKPANIKTCFFLEKQNNLHRGVTPDYIAFTAPPVFVVGYGLDYAEKYRNLPFVGALKESVYRGHHSTAAKRGGHSEASPGK